MGMLHRRAWRALLLVLACAAAHAQDPVLVNARTVKATFENEQVRVLEAVVAPGEKEQMHSHPASIIYVIAGGRIRNHLPDGKSAESELVTGATLYRDAVTHWAENIGTTTIHLVLVELKDAPPKR